MTGERDRDGLRRAPIVAEYEVGYGKPPKASRFKPGQSGNKGGRPKGALGKRREAPREDIDTLIMKEAYRTIEIKDGGRTLTLPLAQAMMRSIGIGAVKGQHRAQRLMMQVLQHAETRQRAAKDEHFRYLLQYKLDWEDELERRKREGIVALDPIPHPDQIEIDVRNGTALIHGPINKEERTMFDQASKLKAILIEGLVLTEADLTTEQDATLRKQIEQEKAYLKRMLNMMAR